MPSLRIRASPPPSIGPAWPGARRDRSATCSGLQSSGLAPTLYQTGFSGKRSVSLFLPTRLNPASKPPRNSLQSSTQGCTLSAIFSGGFTPMLIGYARVSKSDGSQTLAPQRDALIGAGVEPDRIYQDLASGRHDARPGLSACLKALQPGNTLVLWKLDRLGRDLKHLVETAESLRVHGIGLKVLTGAGAQIDTTTSNGRLAFGIFAAFAEFERSCSLRACAHPCRSSGICARMRRRVPDRREADHTGGG